jgi:tetratricopeptide (TPR) repeat protein
MGDDLEAAIALHQSGALEQAARIYQTILERDPHQADALHLLGLVAYQKKDPHRAIGLISQAIAVNPNVAAFYSNLAEAYRGTGQLERAAACCRTALALAPDHAEAANNLGLALLAQGNADAAADQFRDALRLKPGDAVFHNNLGNALRLQGDAAAARAQFHQALAIVPEFAEAHSNLGQLLLEQNDYQSALRHCQEAVRLRPDLPEAQNNLGNVLREQGRLAEAKACYAAVLELNPDLALTYSNMGQALQEEGHLPEAMAWYQQGLQRDPNSARIHGHLASALEEQENYEGAVLHYRVALRLDPKYAEAHNGLGFVLHEQGNYAEALTAYGEVLRLRPAYATGHCNLGNILEELGDFERSLASYREAVRLDPSHASAWSLMATMQRGKLPDEDLAVLRQLLSRPHLAIGKRLALHFGIAHVLDARGEYQGAAEHLRQGNALCQTLWQKQGRAYDPQAHSAFTDQLIAVFSPEFFQRVRGFGLETERPIFIVGLPRSGTTLTEQILASHSQVFGAGELRYLRDDFDALPRFTNARMPVGEKGSGPPPALECLERLERETARRIAQWHLDRLQALNAQASRVADKMPENYLYFGLIATLFPEAKIIHCRRDLRDVAVSCWMTNFRHLHWAADPDHIAARFRDYLRLMEHWRSVLPGSVLDVDYEETVNDLEAVARRLTAWCGLDWEPACLDFHKTSRPVRTASVMQVRQPIYTRSVARWKNYKAALGPLFAQLEWFSSPRRGQ